MHFSRVVGGLGQDLELTFTNPLALRWEDESFGLIGLPKELPKCPAGEFSSWIYPTLVVENSTWAEQYAHRVFTEAELETKSVTHFVFVAMNDLLHVLSMADPEVRLVSPND